MTTPLFEGLHWQSGQAGLFDGPPPKRELDREQYASGYQAGLSGRKLRESHADYLTGYEHGSADRRYNQRANDCAKVFRGWDTLPGQTELAL